MNDKQMREQIIKHVPPLTNAIIKVVIDYLSEHFANEDVHISFILNLLSSAHLSSMSISMKTTAKDKPDILEKVKCFMDIAARTFGALEVDLSEKKGTHELKQ